MRVLPLLLSLVLPPAHGNSRLLLRLGLRLGLMLMLRLEVALLVQDAK